MAGTITHSWNGTVLTITSDAGTSSADLQGAAGDIGPRGPQGPAGVVVGGNGDIDLTGYATEAYVDAAVASVDVDLTGYATQTYVNNRITETRTYVDNKVANVEATVDLSDYYTKSEVDAKIPDVSGYATDDDVAVAVSGLATEVFVSAKIAEAQLGGGDGGNVDLSAYRTIDNHEFSDTVVVKNANGTMNIYSNGIQGADSSLWIGGDGEGCFTDLKIGTVGNYKAVATQEYVDAAIAALDGSEVEY